MILIIRRLELEHIIFINIYMVATGQVKPGSQKKDREKNWPGKFLTAVSDHHVLYIDILIFNRKQLE